MSCQALAWIHLRLELKMGPNPSPRGTDLETKTRVVPEWTVVGAGVDLSE